MVTPSNIDAVKRYYNRTESRLGYRYLLGGTKHFGYYEAGDSAWAFGHAMDRMEDLLVDLLDLKAGQCVLDAGCGMGRVAVHVARASKVRVIGIDVLEFNIEEARRFGTEHDAHGVRFEVGDYNHVPFDNESFDAIYTCETLVHSADPVATLAEFSRLLRPGGILVNFEYAKAPYGAMPPAAADAFKRMNALAAMPAFNEFTYGALEQLLKGSGFVDIAATDITENMLPMLRVFNLIAFIPYAVAKRLGRVEKGVNAMSAVEMWRYRRYWRYLTYRSVKANQDIGENADRRLGRD